MSTKLQQQALEQLHNNLIGIEKTRILILNEIPGKPWETIGADLFKINNSNSFVFYITTQITNIKRAEKVSSDSIIICCKIILAKKGYLRICGQMLKWIFSEKFKEFCRKLNIKQEVSLYHHQCNSQAEVCTYL